MALSHLGSKVRLFGLDVGGFLVWLRGEPGLPWPLDGAVGTVTGVGLSVAPLGL